MLGSPILRTSLIVDIDTLDERYSYSTTRQLQMPIANISSSIFLKDFTLALNRDVRKKEQAFNEEKQASIVIGKKSIKKNEEHNDANLKLVDQLISKEEAKDIANQD
jgi:aspartyl aminopeptidase